MRLSYFRILTVAGALAICAAPAPAEEEGKAVDADSPSPAETLFNKRCAQCHSLAEGKNGNGPSLFGIVNRDAAIVPGFKYSRAMKRMAADESLKWSEETLATFLTKPNLLVPGTRMAFPGIRNEDELAALIEWIKANSGPPAGQP